jgi:hypothetical protein
MNVILLILYSEAMTQRIEPIKLASVEALML